MVYVDDRHAQRLSKALGAATLFTDAIKKIATIGQTRQSVFSRLSVKLLAARAAIRGFNGECGV
jgi:hypothetical protein